MGTALAPIEKLKSTLALARDKLHEVAPRYMNVDRLTRLLLAACSKSPKILECTPESILQFGMKCAETGLEPIGAGGCWPIPYGKVLTFIPDYRGLVHCAVRAGCILNCFAEVVRAADDFDYCLGLKPELTHKPARGDRGDLEAAYCVYAMPDGTTHFTVMDRAEIMGIRKRSKASGSGPWVTDESEMWKKTVIRRAMKPFAGMSSALDAAIEADDAAGGVVIEQREAVTMPRAVGELPSSNGHQTPAATEQEKAPDAEPEPPQDETPVVAGPAPDRDLDNICIQIVEGIDGSRSHAELQKTGTVMQLHKGKLEAAGKYAPLDARYVAKFKELAPAKSAAKQKQMV